MKGKQTNSTPGRELIVGQSYELAHIDDMAPHPRNVNQGDVGAVVESIKKNRFFGAVTVQKSTGFIIAGKHRWLAAKQCGLQHIPAIRVDVTDEEALRILLVDNRTTRLGQDDEAALAVLLKEIAEATGTLDGTGFDGDDLDTLLAELAAAEAKEQPTRFEHEKLESASMDDLAPSEEERATIVGRKILIEYSGGKDSSAVALWAKHFFPDQEIELNFVDMGSDYVGFPLYIHDAAQFIDAKLHVLRSKVTVLDGMLAKGAWPSPLFPYCHNYLHQPLDDYLGTMDPEKVIFMRGGRLAEKARSSKARTSRYLVIDRLKNYLFFQPLYWSDKATSDRTLKDAGMKIWPGYERGLHRTACRICPGQKRYVYSAIRANYPDVWLELLDLQRRFGPGCWGDPSGKMSASFEHMADIGQEKFEIAMAGGQVEEDPAIEVTEA
jgi:3'-phosphoadenosine 5'-phosphosulfate sulfotransferase (PAPS reductase)/FAD synthetase